jgi:hypothetical protein
VSRDHLVFLGTLGVVKVGARIVPVAASWFASSFGGSDTFDEESLLDAATLLNKIAVSDSHDIRTSDTISTAMASRAFISHWIQNASRNTRI